MDNFPHGRAALPPEQSATAIKRDRLALWLLATGWPFALTALFRGMALAFD